jgi:hypothetical protein
MHGSRSKIPSKKSHPYIYDVKFLALLGAPYVYDISRLRVNTDWFLAYWSLRSCIELIIAILVIAMYEETVIDMFIYKLSHDILIFCTTFGEWCRHCVQTSGLSIGSGVTW